MVDWSPDGRGINQTATFNLIFTRGRDTLYRAVQTHHTQAMSHPVFFIGGRAVPSGEPSVDRLVSEELKNDEKSQKIAQDKNRTDSFLGLMDKYGILDVQLLPPISQSDSDYFMRVTRMPMNNTVEFKPDTLLSELCLYH